MSPYTLTTVQRVAKMAAENVACQRQPQKHSCSTHNFILRKVCGGGRALRDPFVP